MNINDFAIKIDVKSCGTIELLGLINKDTEWLCDPQTKELSAREFAASLIQNHLISPALTIETVNGWSDDLLAFIASSWLKNQQKSSDGTVHLSLEEFQEGVYAYYSELVGQHHEIFDSFLKTQQQFATNLQSLIIPAHSLIPDISSSITRLNNLTSSLINPSPLISQLTQGVGMQVAEAATKFASLYQGVFRSTQLVNEAITNIAQMPNLNLAIPKAITQELFASLPNAAEWEELLKESAEANLAFAQAGYSFIDHLVSYSPIRQFAFINTKVRSAVITNSMAATTRSKEFEQRLYQLFEQSSVLRRRWPIVVQAIHAHRRRDYYVSAPALLAQVEGIIGDALILKKLVHREGNQLYLIENGVIKVGRNGDRVKATGLLSLVQHSKWKDDEVLQGVADLITTQLAGERNGIMHGRRVKYGRAKLSVQGLLLLLVLSTMLVELENGRA